MRDRYRIVAATLFSEEVVTRIPFRYGIATMTRLPHVFLQIDLESHDRRARGLAADHLPPKWFTKDPLASLDDEISTMRKVIVHAASLVTGTTFDRVFDFWRELWTAQDDWARRHGHPALLAHLGTSLVERAVIDAFCRIEGITFPEAVRGNHLGLRLGELDPTLPANWSGLLPEQPLNTVTVRHTLGLADEIYERDLDGNPARVDDGLPQSLEAAVKVYGLREFKIKFGGQWEQDAPRLARAFECLATHAPEDWRFSLDGNESFPDAESFRAYWQRLTAEPWLNAHLARLLFVEQPVGRLAALEAAADWSSWPDGPPILIDESDGDLDAVPRALDLGCAGSSHKNCKGVIKGILNRCRITAAAAASPGRTFLMSGEDLCNVAPVALPQDLVVQAVLGNGSVERNGHHYFRGLSMWPVAVRNAVLRAHPGLFNDEFGFCSLRIADGRLDLASVLRAPFGYAADIDPATFCSERQDIG